jgi:alkylmercury lyase
VTSLTTLANSLAGTFPACDDAPLARALLRELAKGEPVAAAALQRAGDEAEVSAALARWPNVKRDDRDHVVAFGGLSLAPTAHRFAIGDRQLYTWCAWDTLFLPALLGRTARVTSTCPLTGRHVRLTVDPSGVRSVDPHPLWVSFPPPSSISTDDITGSFCCHVHFLADRAAADRWLSRHAGGTVLPVGDAFELGRASTRCCME